MTVVQIDFTIADIYLVDVTRTRIVGRPTIALITDTFSRLIIGFAVAWRRESWAVATLAILNMVEDKAEFCAQLGVDLRGTKWPSAMFETVQAVRVSIRRSTRLAPDATTLRQMMSDFPTAQSPRLGISTNTSATTHLTERSPILKRQSETNCPDVSSYG
jgi:hypothetical protein